MTLLFKVIPKYEVYLLLTLMIIYERDTTACVLLVTNNIKVLYTEYAQF